MIQYDCFYFLTISVIIKISYIHILHLIIVANRFSCNTKFTYLFYHFQLYKFPMIFSDHESVQIILLSTIKCILYDFLQLCICSKSLISINFYSYQDIFIHPLWSFSIKFLKHSIISSTHFSHDNLQNSLFSSFAIHIHE